MLFENFLWNFFESVDASSFYMKSFIDSAKLSTTKFSLQNKFFNAYCFPITRRYYFFGNNVRSGTTLIFIGVNSCLRFWGVEVLGKFFSKAMVKDIICRTETVLFNFLGLGGMRCKVSMLTRLNYIGFLLFESL